MTRFARPSLGLLAAAAATAALTVAAPAAHALSSQFIGAGFGSAVFLTAPVGDSRLFVVDRAGIVQVLTPSGSGYTRDTFLDIHTQVDSSGERGLLGLAFDPGYASNGRFYVNYIDATTKNTVVASYSATTPNGSVANAGSGQTVISVAQPAGRDNHKAGWIGFSPTDPGQLYIATGDGGSGNDPENRAQNLSDNLGKILRITPNASGAGYTSPGSNPFAGTAGNDEIWAYGLRNPFRASFDRQTGDFWIADVGQDTREEINLQLAGAAGGANYGWRPREGTVDNPGVGDPAPAGAVDPVFDYAHGTLGATVIGGYVYRGTGEAGLDGSYVFGDFVSGKIFTLSPGAGGLELTDRTAELGTPFDAFELASFGEDGLGNLYALGVNGELYRIAVAVPEPSTALLLALGGGALAAWRRRATSCARR